MTETRLGNWLANGAICVALAICLVSLVSVVWADAAARERAYTASWYTGGTGACGPLTGRYISTTNTHWGCGTHVSITYQGKHTHGVVKDYFGSDCSMCLDLAPSVFDDLAPLGTGVISVRAAER